MEGLLVKYLRMALTAEVLVGGCLMGLLAIRTGWMMWKNRRKADAAVRARTLILRALNGGRLMSAVGGLRELPPSVVEDVLLQFQKAVAGPAARGILELVAGQVLRTRARRLSRSPFWWRRIHGLLTLGLTRSEGVPEVHAAMMEDPIAHVRMAAVELAHEYPTMAVLTALVRRQEDEDPEIGFAAQAALVRSGQPAADFLAKTVTADAPPRLLASGILVRTLLGDARAVDLALQVAGHSDPRVRRAVARAAGAFGGHRVIATLRRLVADDDAAVRQAACTAVGRMRLSPLAEEVAERLVDQNWQVRRQAALALRQLGPRGEALLLQAFWHPDRYGADMARHVLDLPAATIEADLYG